MHSVPQRIGWQLVCMLPCSFTLIAVVAGCTNPPATPPPSTSTAIEIAPTADAFATPPSIDEPHDVLLIESACSVPDPAIDAATSLANLGGYSLVNEIHAGLTRIAEGDNREPILEMELAESFTSNEDTTKFTFTLRDDLKFSDGSPLTAEDVAWSWSRAVALSEEWSAAWRIFGDVAGAEEVANGVATMLDGIEIVDSNTLTVQLSVPSPRFHELIAHTVASVLKEENVDSWPVAWDNKAIPPSMPIAEHPTRPNTPPAQFNEETMPVGAGPFRLRDYRHSTFPSSCHIVANPQYFRSAPRLDAVLYKDLAVYRPPQASFEEESEANRQDLARFLEANLDIVVPRPTTAEHLNQNGMQGRYKTVAASTAPLVLYIALNADQPPFDDAELRKAVYAIMTASASTNANVDDSDGTIAGLKSSNWKFVEDFVPYEATEMGPAVRTRFSALLEKNNVALKSSYSGVFSVLKPALESVSDFFGVDILIEFIESGEEFQQQLDDGEIVMMPLQVNPVHPFNETVINSFGTVFGEVKDSGEFADLRNLLASASTELDPVERNAKYAEIEKRALERALVVPLLVGRIESETIVQPWVHGFNLKRFGGSVFHDVWFDDTAPERQLP